MSVSALTIEPSLFREVLKHYASGITIITSQLDDEPLGFTCQSFYSVSISPPLVSFAAPTCVQVDVYYTDGSASAPGSTVKMPNPPRSIFLHIQRGKVKR